MVVARMYAATKVTGFGLHGHFREVLVASGVGAEANVATIPTISGAVEVESGIFSSRNSRNIEAVHTYMDFGETADP